MTTKPLWKPTEYLFFDRLLEAFEDFSSRRDTQPFYRKSSNVRGQAFLLRVCSGIQRNEHTFRPNQVPLWLILWRELRLLFLHFLERLLHSELLSCSVDMLDMSLPRVRCLKLLLGLVSGRFCRIRHRSDLLGPFCVVSLHWASRSLCLSAPLSPLQYVAWILIFNKHFCLHVQQKYR